MHSSQIPEKCSSALIFRSLELIGFLPAQPILLIFGHIRYTYINNNLLCFSIDHFQQQTFVNNRYIVHSTIIHSHEHGYIVLELYKN